MIGDGPEQRDDAIAGDERPRGLDRLVAVVRRRRRRPTSDIVSRPRAARPRRPPSAAANRSLRTHRLERRQHVVDVGADRRALFQEIVGSFGARIERRARARRTPARFCSSANRAVMSDPEPRAASTTIVPSARPETMRLRRGKSRPRGSHSIGISDTTAPIFDHALDQRHGLVRIGLCVSSGQHADRAGLEARDMRALIDPAREPRRHDVAGPAEAARKPLGESEPGGRGVARADDRDRRLSQRLEPAAAGKDRRGANRSAAGSADSPVRRCATNRTPSFRATSSSRSMSSTRRRPGSARRAPPRRASSGSASSAARAPPNRSRSARKVRGPTFSERTRRSQSNTLLVGQVRGAEAFAIASPARSSARRP